MFIAYKPLWIDGTGGVIPYYLIKNNIVIFNNYFFAEINDDVDLSMFINAYSVVPVTYDIVRGVELLTKYDEASNRIMEIEGPDTVNYRDVQEDELQLIGKAKRFLKKLEIREKIFTLVKQDLPDLLADSYKLLFLLIKDLAEKNANLEIDQFFIQLANKYLAQYDVETTKQKINERIIEICNLLDELN